MKDTKKNKPFTAKELKIWRIKFLSLVMLLSFLAVGLESMALVLPMLPCVLALAITEIQLCTLRNNGLNWTVRLWAGVYFRIEGTVENNSPVVVFGIVEIR